MLHKSGHVHLHELQNAPPLQDFKRALPFQNGQMLTLSGRGKSLVPTAVPTMGNLNFPSAIGGMKTMAPMAMATMAMATMAMASTPRGIFRMARLKGTPKEREMVPRDPWRSGFQPSVIATCADFSVHGHSFAGMTTSSGALLKMSGSTVRLRAGKCGLPKANRKWSPLS